MYCDNGGSMRYYISGKITDNPNYEADFERAEMWLKLQGHEVVNPVNIYHSFNCFTYAEFMKVDLVLLEMCEGIYMLENWKDSRGAKTELAAAKALGKEVKFENKQWALRAKDRRKYERTNRKNDSICGKNSG